MSISLTVLLKNVSNSFPGLESREGIMKKQKTQAAKMAYGQEISAPLKVTFGEL